MATVLKSIRKKKTPQNGRAAMLALYFNRWAKAVGATPKEVESAWNDLKRRSLVSMHQGKVKISAEAMTRANTDIQRRLASYLSDYELTENSYIVRKAGNPSSSPMILNTRIFVEYIASYFRSGWGVADIQRDLPQLTPEQIEAAIQYYLNHRREIELDIQESIDIFEENIQRQEKEGKWPELMRS
jgi:uncharacterized protein (DUF433 family)